MELYCFFSLVRQCLYDLVTTRFYLFLVFGNEGSMESDNSHVVMDHNTMQGAPSTE